MTKFDHGMLTRRTLKRAFCQYAYCPNRGKHNRENMIEIDGWVFCSNDCKDAMFILNTDIFAYLKEVYGGEDE